MSKLFRAMGIDSSTKLGLVVLEEAFVRPTVLHEEEVTSKNTDLERCSDIAAAVVKALNEYHPDVIVMENYGFANQHTLVTLVEIGTVVRYFIRQMGFGLVLVAPNSLKKFVTGSGNSPKDKIMLEVFKNWGHDPKTNNTADAYGLALVGLAYKGKLKVNAKQKEVLKMIEKGAPL